MQILKNRQVDLNKWRSLLKHNPFASHLQSPEFYDFFNSADGFSADVFAVEESDEYLALIVVTIQKEKGLKTYFSRRGIAYGGPLIKNDSHEGLLFLLKEIDLFYKKNLIYLETRNNFDYSHYHEVFTNCRFSYSDYVNFQINIKNFEDSFNSIKSEKRRQIKRALKEGIVIKLADSISEVNDLYAILQKVYKEKAGKPLPDISFFTQLLETFQKNNNGFIVLIMFQNKVIGGAVCPKDKFRVYDWYRCGLDEEYKGLYPSTVSVYAIMKYGHEHGRSLLDFMGAGQKHIPYGVRDFKSQFGGELVEHGRFLRIYNPLLYSLGKAGLSVMKKLTK